MIIHIALFKFRPEISQEEIQQAMKEVKMLKEQIPDILDLYCGQNFSRYADGYTHAIVVKFKDRFALDAYRAHPMHVPIANKLDKFEERGIGVDFES